MDFLGRENKKNQVNIFGWTVPIFLITYLDFSCHLHNLLSIATKMTNQPIQQIYSLVDTSPYLDYIQYKDNYRSC